METQTLTRETPAPRGNDTAEELPTITDYPGVAEARRRVERVEAERDKTVATVDEARAEVEAAKRELAERIATEADPEKWEDGVRKATGKAAEAEEILAAHAEAVRRSRELADDAEANARKELEARLGETLRTMVAELDKKLGDAQEISRAIERLATHGQQAGFGRLVPEGASFPGCLGDSRHGSESRVMRWRAMMREARLL